MSPRSSGRRLEMFKPEYEGDANAGRLTPLEVEAFERCAGPVVRRLYDAMLTLGAMSDESRSGGCSMPEYIHSFADKVGWDATDSVAPPSFRPTRAQIDDLLPALQLVEGLSLVFLKVLTMRAVGDQFGGFSYRTIGERFGKGEAWASRVHAAVVVQACRRAGILEPAPKGWALLVAAVQTGGWRSYLTTAADPLQALYDLKSKSPIELSRAEVLWVAGKPEAARLAKTAREHLLGRQLHGSWHLIPPEDMIDLLIEQQTRLGRPWEVEQLAMPRPRRSAKGAGHMMAASAASEEGEAA